MIEEAEGGKWLANHPQYTLWCDGMASDFLWIEGKPGSGKSTLAKRIVGSIRERRACSSPRVSRDDRSSAQENQDRINPRHRGHVVAEFYNSFRGGAKETSHTLMLRSLVYQIWSQNDRLFPLLQDRYRQLKKQAEKQNEQQNESATAQTDSFWTYAELKTALMSLHHADFPNDVFIIVDGMGESDNGLRSDVLSFLPSLSAHTSKCTIKILIASRPETSINLSLRRGRHIVLQEVNQVDIKLAVDNGIGHLKSLQAEGKNNDAGFSRIHDYIVENSTGVFLWVSLVLKDLERIMKKGIYTMDSLLKRTRNLPKGLAGKDGFYRLMIDSMVRRRSIDGDPDDEEKEKDLQMTRRILAWVTLPENPIRIQELAAALATGIDSDLSSSDGEVQDLREGILFHCGGFVEVCIGMLSLSLSLSLSLIHADSEQVQTRNQAVQLIHQTAREFLLDDSRIASPYHLDQISGDKEIATTCCRYLRDTFTTPIAQLEAGEDYEQLEQLMAYLEERNLLYYCLRYFTAHLNPLGDLGESISEEFEAFVRLLSKRPNSFASLLLALWLKSSGPTLTRLVGLNDAASKQCLQTTLISAVASQRRQVVDMLILLKVDVNKPNASNQYALDFAAKLGKKRMIYQLLHYGAAISPPSQLYSPLVSAISNGHSKIVRLLIDNGADVNAHAPDLANPVQIAASMNDYQTVLLLIKRGADVNAFGLHFGTALEAAISNGHLETVCHLINNGADVNWLTGDNLTPLQLAASKGYVDIASRLLDAGASCNMRVADTGTPLQIAIFEGHQGVVSMLLDKANNKLDLSGPYGTALQIASSLGDEWAVRRLLSLDAEVNIQGWPHRSALHLARAGKHETIVQLLIEHGAEIWSL